MGLIFENELYDMTKVAMENLRDESQIPITYHGNHIFEEVPYDGYRTDLVTTYTVDDKIDERSEIFGDITPIPPKRKFIRSYNKIRDKGPMTRNYWINEDSTYRTEQICREVWDWFNENGYLFDSGDGKMIYPYQDVLMVNAFELKQKDWQKAIKQAERAKMYADYRWVVMDEGYIENVAKNTFEGYGVGLMSLNREEVTIHVYPDKCDTTITQTRQYLNEKTLKRKYLE